MFRLTKEERLVLILLAAVVLAGNVLLFAVKTNAYFRNALNFIELYRPAAAK